MLKTDNDRIKVWPYMLACFALWMFIFRGFIFGDLAFDSDAISYYEHIKFYVDNIARGVFPLWDPLWMSGAPNEFFLRRICPYNPFLSILVLLAKTPIPYKTSYLLYLSGYYFLGMSGFYLLSRTVLKNSLISLFSFAFLLFSGLGVRLFDSYFLFVSTPLIWFFYFFLNWIYAPCRLSFTGMTFCAMILLSTYIPFYFIVIFAMFLVFLCLVYADKVWDALKRIFRFLSGNKLLAVVCTAALLCAMVPGYMFVKDSNKGDFVFPQRHGQYEDSSQLSVSYEAITSWTSIEDLHYSHNFPDLKKYQPAIHYLPVYLFFVLCVGFFTGVNRKLVLMFIWMFFIIVMCSPHAPIYKFLYEHIFFFKYFRNLHFFLWFILTPLFVLFVCEQFRQIHEAVSGRMIRKKAVFLLNVAAHALFLFWVFDGGHHGLMTTYVTVGLSFVVWSLVILKPDTDPRVFLSALLIVIVLQPFELYHHFTKNYPLRSSSSLYEAPFNKFSYVVNQNTEDRWQHGSVEKVFEAYFKQIELYYASGGYSFLFKLIHQSIVFAYTNQKIYLYDNTKFVADLPRDIALPLRDQPRIGCWTMSFEKFDIIRFL
jgi:hypothetical protein